MSDEKLIGHGVCPICSNAKARFTVSKKLLACMTCNACNLQCFARSDSSDEKLRSFIKATPAPGPIDPVIEAEKTPVPEIENPADAGGGWGLFRGKSYG
jgi:hypothetical protein